MYKQSELMMEMLRKLIVLLTCVGTFGETDLCLRGLDGWKGNLVFPDEELPELSENKLYTDGENLATDCIFYIQSQGSANIVVKFKNVDIGKAVIKVKEPIETDNSMYWETKHTFTGYIPEDIEIRPNKGVDIKIVVEKQSKPFEMEYEHIACQPPNFVRALACTKDNYMDSHCIFECAEGFYPSRLDNPRLHAHCTRDFLSIVLDEDNYYWETSGKSFEDFCIEKSILEEKCFKEMEFEKNTDCPYSIDDLIKLMEKDHEIPNIIFKRSIPAKCERHCQLDAKTRKYFSTCKSLRRPKGRETCAICRYSPIGYCQGGSII